MLVNYCNIHPVVYMRAHVLFTLYVFVCVKWCPTHIALCFCFVSLDCLFFLFITTFSMLNDLN